MDNTLAKKFNFISLIIFAIPNVIMMIILSLYIIVDGMFIARILGTTALSAANMIYPMICFEMALAIMLATGGSAIIARKLGEGKQEEARQNLSFLIVIEFLLGILISVIGNLFIEQIISFLGASTIQFQMCITYAKILFTFAPAFFLQSAFQTFLVTAGKPVFGLIITLMSGISNIFLDYVFMIHFDMGIAGAALATGIGYCIPAIVGMSFFITARNNPLHFVKPKIDWNMFFHSCTNGSSEMVTNLANATTTFLFNYMFLKYYGEDGVASITIILYFQYIFTALYFGYSNGIAPIISFKYGYGDKQQLRKIFKGSILFLTLSTIVVNVIVHLMLKQAITIFTAAGSNVYDITIYGFSIYSLAFLIMGVGIFSSALFTAFSDGKTSAIISFSRTFVFLVASILIFPNIFNDFGLWIAVPIAEGLGTIIAILFLIIKKSTYAYA